MAYIEAAGIRDLPMGRTMAVSLAGRDVLVANIDGAFYAMQRKCPHMGADLCKGKLVGSTLTCPRHAASFDVRTGKVLQKAAVLFLKLPVKDAATFPVRTDGEKLRIAIP